ncbi:MAG: methyltransferase domain-containing protein [Parcubacteria group bacterium]|nr:methyltransferase domain-containing protein [Parcubacteria group bacterium]
MGIKLNLGCGNKKIPGFIGVDRVKTAAADLIHDLNIRPYPFADNSVDEIIADNVLEHLNDIVAVMAEWHRICRPGAIIKISLPYYKSSGAFSDPTHQHFFTENSFQYFSPEHEYHFYAQTKFKTLKIKLLAKDFNDFRHKLRNLLPFKKFFNFWLFNIYDEIYFELACVK